MPHSSSIDLRLATYANTRGLRFQRPLGFGKDGRVFLSNQGNAVKIFDQQNPFQRELECYRRLAYANTREILGHSVPQFLNHNDQLLVIEMTVVEPPYILDFASAYLDWPPDFSPEVLEQCEQDRSELFGANWPAVKRIISIFENQFDIYLLDIHPGNIKFAP